MDDEMIWQMMMREGEEEITTTKRADRCASPAAAAADRCLSDRRGPDLPTPLLSTTKPDHEL